MNNLDCFLLKKIKRLTQGDELIYKKTASAFITIDARCTFICFRSSNEMLIVERKDGTLIHMNPNSIKWSL